MKPLQSDDPDHYAPEFVLIWGAGALLVAMLIIAGMLIFR